MTESFEKWAAIRGYSLEKTPDSYKSQATKSAWRAWRHQGRRVAELEAHNETRNIELLASVQQCAQLKAQLAEAGEQTPNAWRHPTALSAFITHEEKVADTYLAYKDFTIPLYTNPLVADCAGYREDLANFSRITQERVDDLKAQLADHKKLLLLAKDALVLSAETISAIETEVDGDTETLPVLMKAIAAIKDSKLVEGLILCDAEPVAHQYQYSYDINGDKQGNWPVEMHTHVSFSRGKPTSVASTPLYAPRRTEK